MVDAMQDDVTSVLWEVRYKKVSKVYGKENFSITVPYSGYTLRKFPFELP